MASRLNFGQRATPSTLAGLRAHGLGDALTAYILGGTGAAAPQTMALSLVTRPRAALPATFLGGDLTAALGLVTRARSALPATFLLAAPTVSAFVVFTTPADGEPRAEVTPVMRGQISPSVVANPVVTITADVDGASVSVASTAVSGGARTFSLPFPWRFGRTYTVTLTATTQDGNPNVFVVTFTTRRATKGLDRMELVVGRAPVLAERVEAVVGRAPQTREAVYLVARAREGAFREAVELRVTPGLGATNVTREEIRLVVASLVEIENALPLAFDVGDLHTSQLAVAYDVSARPVYDALAVSYAVKTPTSYAALPVAYNASPLVTSELPVSFDVGDPVESELAVAYDADSPLLEPLTGQASLRNEDLAREEDE